MVSTAMFPRLLVLVFLLQNLALTSADDIIPRPLEDELQALQWVTQNQEKTKQKLRPLFENGEKGTSEVDEVYENPFFKPDPNSQHHKQVSTKAYRENTWDLLRKEGFNGEKSLKNIGRIDLTEPKNLFKTTEAKETLPSTLERVDQQIHSTPDGENNRKSTKIKGDFQLAVQHSLIQKLKNLQQKISMALGKSQKAKITPGDPTLLKPVKNKSDNVLKEHLWPFKEEIFAGLPKDGSYGIEKSELDGPVDGSSKSVIDYLELAGNRGSQKSVDLKGIIGDGFRMKERVQGRGRMQGDTKEAETKAEKMLVGENGKMEERMRERERMKNGNWEKEREGERRIMGKQKEMKKRMIGGDIVTSARKDGEKEKYKVMVEKVKEGKPTISGRPSNVIKMGGEWENVGKGTEGGIKELETVGDTVATNRRMIEWDEGMTENKKQNEMKERIREQDGRMTENRMEQGRRDNQDEQMVVGKQNKMKERMREREKVMGNMAVREREGERMVTGENRNMRERKHVAVVDDKNHVMMRFQHQKEDWLPGWVIKGRSRGEAKGRKTEGGVQVEMQKEREFEGHKISYI